MFTLICVDNLKSLVCVTFISSDDPNQYNI